MTIAQTCPLCGSTEHRILTDRIRGGIERAVLRCTACTLTFLDQPHCNDIDYAGGGYRQQHGPVPGQGISPADFFAAQRPYQAARIERVRHFLAPKVRLLEIGSATGHFLDAVSPLVATAIGIEPDESQVRFARDERKLDVRAGTLDTADLGDSRFDVIVTFQVLEHVPDPLHLLQLCRERLVPSGRIYIEVPNVDDVLLSLYALPAFSDFYFRSAHLYYYSPSTLEALLSKAGFTGETRTFQTYSLFNHVHWLQNARPQPDFTSGVTIPRWPGSERNHPAEAAIRDWLTAKNEEYKCLLESLGLADNISYTGTRDQE